MGKSENQSQPDPQYGQHYPPQYWQQAQVPPQAAKGRKSWVSMTVKEKRLYGGITAGLVALVPACVVWACAGVGANSNAGAQASGGQQQATSTSATTTMTGVTLLTLSGGDNSATHDTRSATFNVTGDWQIHYTCQTDSQHDKGSLYAVVHNGNGSDATMSGPLGPSGCPKRMSSGTVTFLDPNINGEPQSQIRYLDVGAVGVKWKITVTA